MNIFEIHYIGNYGGIVIKTVTAKDEADALKKAKGYCDNPILRIEYINPA
ncbi:hypothetical protein [Desulfitobacterium chlororespirans]|uniref:Uncharacterized protein n=1 Tax=Desulfitobacterium chlororespirans DSM 11544 TaxID=1121395 RepID=A0A1M7UP48_9FIRM|nr:hypothetical protein [Desulfitobacterium chlororespirans]SHN84730.1 hypothetical protein SAMN02745215_04264 [Desulfitobacterium chlororespirans DSM 11544]